MRGSENGPRDGDDDELPTMREMLRVEINRWTQAELVARAHADHLRSLLSEIDLRPAGEIVRMMGEVVIPPEGVREAATVAGAERIASEAVAMPGGAPADPNPTMDEIVASGVADAFAAGRTLWWRHELTPSPGGFFYSGAIVYENRGGMGIAVTRVSSLTGMVCATEATARLLNVGLVRSFIADVSGRSLSVPIHLHHRMG
jgi:hypothetical protein